MHQSSLEALHLKQWWCMIVNSWQKCDLSIFLVPVCAFKIVKRRVQLIHMTASPLFLYVWPLTIITHSPSVSPSSLSFLLLSFSSVWVLRCSQLLPSMPERRNVPEASALCLQAWLKWEGMRTEDSAHTPLSSTAWERTHQRPHHRSHEWTQCGTPATHTSASAS